MTTPLLAITELAQGQAEAYPTTNQALRRLEAALIRVLSRSTPAQPGSPTDGAAYVIPVGATGTQWATYTAGQIAYYSAGTWYAFTPPAGMSLPCVDEGLHIAYSGTAWVVDVIKMAALADGAQDTVSTSALNYAYQGFRFGVGSTITDVPAGSVALTASATNYVEYDNTGAVSANTTGFTPGLRPMSEVVTSASGITSVTDMRVWQTLPRVVTLDVSLSTSPAVAAGTFTKIPLDTVNTDTMSGWDNTNHQYTIPVTGTYLLSSFVRFYDGSLPQGTSWGQAIGTALVDISYFYWTGAITSTRDGSTASRVAHFTKGDVIFLYTYSDVAGSLSGSGTSMSLALLSEG